MAVIRDWLWGTQWRGECELCSWMGKFRRRACRAFEEADEHEDEHRLMFSKGTF